MSLQESKYLTSLLTILAVALWYGRRSLGRWQEGVFDGDSGLVALGASVLWFIAALVGAGILTQILLVILRGILGAEIDAPEDERARQIEYRAMNAAFTVLSIFFIGAMLALVFGHGAVAAILAIVAGFVAAGLVADIWRITLYRRGLRI